MNSISNEAILARQERLSHVDDPVSAHLAYAEALVKHRGKFARLS